MLISKDQLCALIPHAGSMCLLDEVLEWDDEYIICQTRSHNLPDNPLRCKQGLSSIHGIEYGAQAMAVHGGLLARCEEQEITQGLLVAAHEVNIEIEWLDQINEPVSVRADKIIRNNRYSIYEFILAVNDRILVKGRTTVMMDTQLK